MAPAAVAVEGNLFVARLVVTAKVTCGSPVAGPRFKSASRGDGASGGPQHLDAGERLALQPFEERAAGGRDELKSSADAGVR